MLASLITFAVLAPALAEPQAVHFELGAGVGGTVTHYGSFNGVVVQSSAGPGAFARVVVLDVLWVEAWGAASVDVGHWHLAPVFGPVQLTALNPPHLSATLGWRWTLVHDELTLNVGAGPSLDRYGTQEASDLVLIQDRIGVMPMAVLRWRAWDDLHVDARVASSIVPSTTPTGSLMFGAGLSWTLR